MKIDHTKDYYKILGIKKEASYEEIKKSYRSLARKYHPDINKDKDTASKFSEVSEAWEVLGDENLRQQYDDIRAGNRVNDNFRVVNAGDLIPSVSPGHVRRGANLQVNINLSFYDQFKGSFAKNVIVDSYKKCEHCNLTGVIDETKIMVCPFCKGQGVGWQIGRRSGCPLCSSSGKVFHKEHACSHCQGKGVVPDSVQKDVEIPAGVFHGAQVIKANEGGSGFNGGPRGNLILNISIEAHELYSRHDYDLVMPINLTLEQAMYGAKMDIPHPGGDMLNLDIPPGTQHDTVFSFKGKGFYNHHQKSNGDMRIITKVQIPAVQSNVDCYREYIVPHAINHEVENSLIEKEIDTISDNLERVGNV